MKQILIISILISTFIFHNRVSAQQEIFLYPGINHPNPTGESLNKILSPSITAWLPVSNTDGKTITFCPVNGNSYFNIKREGISRELNKQGIAAIVLKYRLPDNVKIKL